MKVRLIFVFIFLPLIVLSQTAGDYRSVQSGNWSDASTWEKYDGSSWVAAATPPDKNAPTTTIRANHTVKIDASAECNNLVIQSNGRLETASGVSTNLDIYGDFINNGNVDFYTSSSENVVIVFRGGGNSNFSTGNSNTDIYEITVDKDNINDTVILSADANFLIQGQNSNAPGFLNLNKGTFKFDGTVSLDAIIFASTSTSIKINDDERLWLNNPNFTARPLSGNLTVYGELRVSAGTFNVTNTQNKRLIIENHGTYIQEGGTVNIEGAFYASPNDTVNVIITGGELNVAISQVTTSYYRCFRIGDNTASQFTMSGGTINIINTNTASYEYEVSTTEANTNITGGVLNIGTDATADDFNFYIEGRTPSIVVDNTNNTKTAIIYDNTYTYGDIILNGNMEFPDGSKNLYIYGDLIINSGAHFSVYNNPSANRTEYVYITGNIIADGDFDGFVDNGNQARIYLYFEGDNSVTVSGSGNTFEVFRISVNKTPDINTIVDIQRPIDLISAETSPTDDRLYINSGTLKISDACQWTAYYGGARICEDNARLWLNHQDAIIQGSSISPGNLNVYGTLLMDNGSLKSYKDIVIQEIGSDTSLMNNGSIIAERYFDLENTFIMNGGTITCDSSFFVDGNHAGEKGKFILNDGTVNIGDGNDHLVLTGEANGTDGYGGKLFVHGGVINVFGHFTINNGSGQEQCEFTMDGGTIKIDPQATKNYTNADLVRFNTNAIVNFTGGKMIIVDPEASKDGAGDEELDINGDGSRKNFTGSTIQFGDGSSDAQGSADYPGFRINVDAGIRLGNVIFDNPSTSKYRYGFIRNDLACDTLILNQASDTLVINGNTLRIAGDFTNNGLLDGTVSGSHLIFDGSVAQTYSGSGSVKEYLPQLTFDNSSSTGVTLNSDLGAIVVNINDGNVYTSASPNGLLTVYGTAVDDLSVASGSAVVSYLRRAIPSSASGDNYVFPLGSASAFRQLEFMDLTTGGSGSGFITAMVSEPQNPTVNGTAGTGLADPLNEKDIYWKMSFDLSNVTISSSPTPPKVRLTYDVSSEIAPFCIAQSNNDINGTYNSIGRIIGTGNVKSETFDLTSNGGLVPSGDAYLLIAQIEPIQGTLTVGNSGDVLNLTKIADTLRKNFIKGQVIFELLDDYDASTETVPVVFDVIQKVNPTDAVLIRPQSGVSGTQTILSGSDSAIIYFKGVSSIRFDGRPGSSGSGDWIFANSNSPAGWVFEFTDGAQYDTLSYLSIKSDIQNLSRGVVHFASTSIDKGNKHNVILNCDITGYNSTPIIAITSQGDPIYPNDSNIVQGNNIYDFFSATENPYGVYLIANSNYWTIKQNRFYQTTNRTFSEEQYYAPIYIDCGQGHLIDGNIIGYADNAGNGKTTISGSTSHFVGIWLNPDNGTQTKVINNHIDGIDFTSNYDNIDGPGVFTGIYVPSGNSANILIGNQTQGNIIGSTSAADQIIITSENGSASYGIRYGGSYDIQILGNTIAGLRVKGIDADDDIRFYGIYNNNRSLTIRYNFIGASTVNNSIQLGESGNTTGAVYFIGIYNYPNRIVNISDNTICNVTGYGTASRGYFAGIYFLNGGGIVNNNTIFNLSTLSSWNGTVGTPTICGIRKNSTSNLNISNNEIYSLGANYDGNTIVRVAGISIGTSDNTTDTINANFIHNLYNNANNNSAYIYGIVGYAGNLAIFNNMVSLGYMPDGSDITTPTQFIGIYDLTPKLSNYYFNSVFVGGSNVADGSWDHTFCYFKEGTDYSIIENNIFVNIRSNQNASSNSNHFAIDYSDDEIVKSDYNIYYVSGTGGYLFFVDGQTFTTLRDLRAYGYHDLHSGVGDPNFTNPTADASNCDLHISSSAPSPVEGTGRFIAGIATDIDGQDRSSLSPVDIGADAGDFNFDETVDIFTPNFDYTPFEPQICGTNSVTIDVTITDQGTGLPTSGSYVPRVYYRDKNQDWSSSSSAAGTLISGDGNNGVWRFTLSGLTDGTFYEYYFVAQDQAATPNIWYSQFDAASPVHSDVNTPTTYPDADVPVDAFTVCVYPNSTYYVGNSSDCGTCDFENLTGYGQLFYNLNAMIIDKDVTCYIAANTDEPATYGLEDLKYENGPYRIIIKPVDTTSVEKEISAQSSVNKALIRLEGADSITIDGQNAGDQNRWLVFKHYGDDQPVIRFVNNATYDTIKYCQLRGSGKLDPRGIVFFDTTNVDKGNSNIVITHNFITNQGQPPLNAIYNYGSEGKDNSDNEISYNIIGNFKINGIYLTSNGTGDNWLIDHNVIYNSYVGDSLETIIRIEGGKNHLIKNNLLGGSNETATGDPTTNSGNLKTFYAIYLDVNTNQITTLDSNIIRNISMTYNGGNKSTYGIYVNNGLVNITNNTIDSLTTNRSGYLYGIYYKGVSNVSIDKDTLRRLIHNGTSDLYGVYIAPKDMDNTITFNGNVLQGFKHNGASSTADMRLVDINAGKVNITNNAFGGNNTDEEIYFAGNSNFYGLYIHNSSYVANINSNVFNNFQINNASIARIINITASVDNTSFSMANNSFNNISINANDDAAIISLNDGVYTISSNLFGNSGTISFSGSAPAYVIYDSPGYDNSTVSTNIISNVDAVDRLTIIYADADGSHIATIANNIIRDINSSNDLIFTGIKLNPNNVANVDGNQLYNITLSGANSQFIGIEALAGTVNVGQSAANEIGLSGYNITVSGPKAIGILADNDAGNANILNNKISYFDLTSTASGAYIAGIMTLNDGQKLIKGNTIHDLTSNSTKTDISDGILAIQGIMISGNAVQSIDSNFIYGLSANSSDAINLAAIAENSQTATITRNRIYSLSNASSGGTVSAVVLKALSTGYVANNMIAIGEDDQTEYSGIWIPQYDANTKKIYFNSIYIGGNATGGNSYAFLRGNNSTPLHLRNNIFANFRTGGSGKHYAIGNLNTADWDSTYIFATNYYSANSSTIGLWGSTDCDFTTWTSYTKEDAYYKRSFELEPNFTDPSVADLHLADYTNACIYNSVGETVADVDIDYDGETRSSHPDIGADEFTPTGRSGDYVWRGWIDNNWDNISNWQCETVPPDNTVSENIVVPAADNQPVIDRGDPANPVVINGLIIRPDAYMTVNPSSALTLQGALTLDGQLILETPANDSMPTATLIDNGTITGTGKLIAKRFINAKQWHEVSAPIVASDATSAIFTRTNPSGNFNPNFYYYDETVDLDDNPATEPAGAFDSQNLVAGWKYAHNGESGSDVNLQENQGYLFLTDQNQVITFEGTPATGNYDLSNLSFTENDPDDDGDNVPDLYDGWHLLGNPYPSYLDWDLIRDDQISGIDDGIYIWDDGQYAGYKNGVSVMSGNLSNLIPPMQGFFVHVNNTTNSIQIRNEHRTHGSQKYLKKKSYLNDLLKLKTVSNGLKDYFAIYFEDNATDDYDEEYDLLRMFTSREDVPQLYAFTQSGDPLSLSALPAQSIENCIVPLGFAIGKASSCSISLEQLNGFDDINIYFKDKLLDSIIPVRNGFTYNFDVQDGREDNRFELIFTKNNPPKLIGTDTFIVRTYIPAKFALTRYFSDNDLYDSLRIIANIDYYVADVDVDTLFVYAFAEDTGVYPIDVQAIDRQGKSVSGRFYLEVLPNRPPVYNLNSEVFYVRKDNEFSVDAKEIFNDPDFGDKIKVSVLLDSTSWIKYDGQHFYGIAQGIQPQQVKVSAVDLANNLTEKIITFVPFVDDLIIYPNPTNSDITIVLADDEAVIQIFDVNGKLIREQNVRSGQKINTKFLPSGTYIIKLKNTNILKKLIKY